MEFSVLFCFVLFLLFSASGLSLQEEPGVERGQSGYPPTGSRTGLGCTAGH